MSHDNEVKAENPPTPVLFRIDRSGDNREICAVFPFEPATENPDTMTCYAHFGQHGACSSEWVRDQTKPATPDQYASLKTELESLGYVLLVRHHIPGGGYMARLAKLRRMDAMARGTTDIAAAAYRTMKEG